MSTTKNIEAGPIAACVAAVDRIENALDEYAAGWKNTDALSIIGTAIREIGHRVNFGVEGYRMCVDGHVFEFDHGYAREKLSSLKEEVDALYSPRKHERWGGVDTVKRHARSNCCKLRSYFSRPWLQIV
ncbi:MAG: hypothetical protein WCC22_13070 [Terriglobales bacterium]